MFTEQVHIPVLSKEVMQLLDPKPGEIVVDATIDGGGHSREIIRRILPDGKLVGIEQDEKILDTLISNFQFPTSNVSLLNGNFRNLDELLKSVAIKKIDVALFDLGMSSFHLDRSCRGFSFQKDEPLSMNYKFKLAPDDLTAKEILNRWNEKDLYQIFKVYGEEKNARSIAKRIVDFRGKHPLKTTFDLVKIIGGKQGRGRHPATKIFQALRIAVNDELNVLVEGLAKVWDFLGKDGRLAVISFHSLEDRIVKNFFRDKVSCENAFLLTKKPVRPSEEEVRNNPRSRSARLRVIKKR